jgi:hypothetical protein
MMRQFVLFAALGLSAWTPAAAQPALVSPYRDLAAASVRGLTPAEVEALREGQGMRLALAAELNRYPGPRHVLDAAGTGALALAADQLAAVRAVFERMSADARRLGGRILAEEHDLEAAFRAGAVTAAGLDARVTRIAGLRGELRLVHLRAHLETRALLDADQLARYQQLRGYEGSPAPPATPHPGHRH